MFSRSAYYLVLALPVLAAASVLPRDDNSNQCTTGTLQCCKSAQSATSSAVSGVLGPLGIVVGDVTGLVGLTCSPITVIGVSGNSCTDQPVCCTNNSFNGVVALGCTPITL